LLVAYIVVLVRRGHTNIKFGKCIIALYVCGCECYKYRILVCDVLSEEQKCTSQMFEYTNKPTEESQHRRRVCEYSPA
jgi:hypothetical protein